MQNIVLVGFKSCGKTSTGKCLARLLGKSFIDLDNAIERVITEHDGHSISHIDYYADYGPARFRQMERTALEQCLKNRDMVLSTGGGAPVCPNNRNVLKKLGIVVYIKTRPDVLMERYRKTRIPPFLQNEHDTKTLETLWSSRDSVYREVSDVTLEAGTLTPSEMAGQLKDSFLNGRLFTVRL